MLKKMREFAEIQILMFYIIMAIDIIVYFLLSFVVLEFIGINWILIRGSFALGVALVFLVSIPIVPNELK